MYALRHYPGIALYGYSSDAATGALTPLPGFPIQVAVSQSGWNPNETLAYDPAFPPGAGPSGDAPGVVLTTLDHLLERSDFVSIHAPALPETMRLFDAERLSRMKRTAYLINTARGSLVCEADLIGALKAKKIAGAGLDVFEQEPPSHSALFEMDNVVVTPHAAGVDLQSRDDMAESAARGVVDLSRGQWPAEKIVNPEVRDRFQW